MNTNVASNQPYQLLPEYEVLLEVRKTKVSKRKRPNYIKWVQSILNQSLGVNLVVDGIAGVKTRSAVRSFQKKSGLVVDGIIGPKTEAALIKVNPLIAQQLSAVKSAGANIPKSKQPESIRRLAKPNLVSEVGIEVDPVSTGVGIITTIFNNEGDVKWELDQMKEPKNPGNDNRWEKAGTWTSATQDIYVYMNTVLGDEISARFRVSYQYNGHSVGNVYIEVINTEDAAFWGLSVTAKIRPDLNVFNDNGKQPVALVSIQYTYRFDHFFYDDRIYSGQLQLFGSGNVISNGRATQ